MIYKIEIDDDSFIESEACSIDKYVLLHILQGFKTHDNILKENIINLELNESMCRNIIKAIRFSLDDLNY